MRASVSVILLAAALAAGCDSAPAAPVTLPETVRAHGVVRMDGEPLIHAEVHFLSLDDVFPYEAHGVTDEQGRFELTTVVKGQTLQGAVATKYKVTVNKMKYRDGRDFIPGSGPAPAMVNAMDSLPPRISDPLITEIRVEVLEEGGEITIALTKEGNPFGSRRRPTAHSDDEVDPDAPTPQ